MTRSWLISKLLDSLWSILFCILCQPSKLILNASFSFLKTLFSFYLILGFFLTFSIFKFLISFHYFSNFLHLNLVSFLSEIHHSFTLCVSLIVTFCLSSCFLCQEFPALNPPSSSLLTPPFAPCAQAMIRCFCFLGQR